MTESEIKLVAELLAKIGGTWYPDRTQAAARPVSNRHREVARLIIEAVDRSKVQSQSGGGHGPKNVEASEAKAAVGIDEGQIHIGAIVEYRPPGDKRTLTCRIAKKEHGRAYIVPVHREIGWVSTHSLLPLKPQRETRTRPRPSPGVPPADDEDAPASALLTQTLEFAARHLKVGKTPANLIHYFSSSGEWIAYRRSESDRYLFDRKGNWIGWFPWNDNEIVDINGQYLGTVFYKNRIFRKISPARKRREAGFVVHPGPGGYAGYPGFAAHRPPPHGFTDIDLAKIPTARRYWLKNSSLNEIPNKPSKLQLWMGKIGLGGLARGIERMIARLQ